MDKTTATEQNSGKEIKQKTVNESGISDKKEAAAEKGRWAALLQFIKFGLVGVSNTLICEGIYAVLLYFKMHYLLANLIGFAISVLNAYYWNNKFVFKEQEDKAPRVWWKTLGKTYLAYLGGYITNALLLILWMDIVRIERFMTAPAAWFASIGFENFDATFLAGVLAAFINLVLTVPMNYLINKYWAFRQKNC